MKLTALVLVSIAVSLAILLAGCVPASSKIPPEINRSTGGWPMANCAYDNSRATVSSTINLKNVSTLGIAWAADLTGISDWGAMASNPIILNNTVYCQDLKSNTYAIDLNTGKIIWKNDYGLDILGPNGPALGWGKLFIVKGHYEVTALELSTGKELWSTKFSQSSIGIDIQLMAYNGTVLVSTVPGTTEDDFYTGGNMGVIYALDQEAGAIKWKFNTVDSDDVWGNPKVNSGGGCWYPPAVDTVSDISYWGTGNPAPIPGTKEYPSGSSRPGPNLYTEAMLALDSNTGKLLWYQQVKPHDLFDLDFQDSPVLATARIAGKDSQIVIGTGKLGVVYAFDRKTGDIYWKTPVGVHQNDDLQELPAGRTTVVPGPDGGVITPIAAANGRVYVPVVNNPCDYTPEDQIWQEFKSAAGTGELVALDINTGKPVWSTKFDSPDMGAATVVNDLVFTSTLDGTVYALNNATGKIVWSHKFPGNSINRWPAASGDFILFPVGVGPSPRLYAFKVGAAVSQ